MGRSYRWTTQLGVAEKLINGQSVGWQVGFVCGESFLCSIRRNVVFGSEKEALQVLESLERNTQTERHTHRVTARGLVRFPNGDGYEDKGDHRRW